MRRVLWLVLVSEISRGEPPRETCIFGGRVTGHAASSFTVVGLEPAPGSPEFLLPPSKKVPMHQRDFTFQPATLVVNVGDWVEFWNDDSDFHSVFSSTREFTFDLRESNRGLSGDRHFVTPGIAHIQCNIHKQMAADIIVVRTPMWVEVALDGTWHLSAPVGTWRVVLSDSGGARDDSLISGCSQSLELKQPRSVVARPRGKTGDVGSPYDLSNH